MNNLKEDSSFSNIQNAELLSRRTKAAGEITRNGEIKSTLQIGEEIDNVMASEEELKNRRIIKIKNISERTNEENLNLFPPKEKTTESTINLFNKDNRILDNPFRRDVIKQEQNNDPSSNQTNLNHNNPFINVITQMNSKNNISNSFFGGATSNPFFNKCNDKVPSTTNSINSGLNSFAFNEKNTFFGKINSNFGVAQRENSDSDDNDEDGVNPEEEVKVTLEPKIKDFLKDSKPEISPYTKVIKVSCENLYVFDKNASKFIGKGAGDFSIELCEGKGGLIAALVYRNNTNTIFNGSMIAIKTSFEIIEKNFKKLIIIRPIFSKEESKLIATSLKVVPLNEVLVNQLFDKLNENKKKVDESFIIKHGHDNDSKSLENEKTTSNLTGSKFKQHLPQERTSSDIKTPLKRPGEITRSTVKKTSDVNEETSKEEVTSKNTISNDSKLKSNYK